MPPFIREEPEVAASILYQQMSPTPQHICPNRNAVVGTEVWVKHKNHTPAGAFRPRGGVTCIDWLARIFGDDRGVCMADRGNHAQSQARATTDAWLIAKICVPEGRFAEKNAALAAFVGDVVLRAADFDVARVEAKRAKRVSVTRCGGNIDRDQSVTVLKGSIPQI